jgi:hypothetical protein
LTGKVPDKVSVEYSSLVVPFAGSAPNWVESWRRESPAEVKLIGVPDSGV